MVERPKRSDALASGCRARGQHGERDVLLPASLQFQCVCRIGRRTVCVQRTYGSAARTRSGRFPARDSQQSSARLNRQCVAAGLRAAGVAPFWASRDVLSLFVPRAEAVALRPSRFCAPRRSPLARVEIGPCRTARGAVAGLMSLVVRRRHAAGRGPRGCVPFPVLGLLLFAELGRHVHRRQYHGLPHAVHGWPVWSARSFANLRRIGCPLRRAVRGAVVPDCSARL